MNKTKKILFSLVVVIIMASGFTRSMLGFDKGENMLLIEKKQYQTINMFVTHGHCSTPFSGKVDQLKVAIQKRDDLGNPLENMEISFQIDPNTFYVCAGEELTAKIKTPGLFIGENKEKITFKSTNLYTMGIDWYQVNGKLTIKGVEKEVKFFATGIRDPKEAMSSLLVIEGQINLHDWGIDYDKIVNGKSDLVPTKWMHFNMKVDLSENKQEQYQ